MTTTQPNAPSGFAFDGTYHAAGNPGGNPPYMRRMIFYNRSGARYDTSGKISKGTLRITGRFKSKHHAVGTLSWKVKTRKGNHTCKSGPVHFTAKSP